MTSLCCDVLEILRSRGLTLATAESLTGGGIGAALTSIPGASDVFKGGVICYMNQIKEEVLGVSREILDRYGAVSPWTAGAMATGVRRLLQADIAVSVTGLAGPGGDEFGHAVGTVYIGLDCPGKSLVTENHFLGTRDEIREQTVTQALQLILNNL